jgi:hypothetical protein
MSRLSGNALVKRWGVGWHRVSRVPRTILPYEERKGRRATFRTYRLRDVKAYEKQGLPGLPAARPPCAPGRDAKIRAMRLTKPRPSYVAIGKAFGVSGSMVGLILRQSGGDPAAAERRAEDVQREYRARLKKVEDARVRLAAELEHEQRQAKARAARKTRRQKATWERQLLRTHESALRCDRILEALRACAAREGTVPPNGPRFQSAVGYSVHAVRCAFGSLNSAFRAAGLLTRPSGPPRTAEAAIRSVKRMWRKRRKTHEAVPPSTSSSDDE